MTRDVTKPDFWVYAVNGERSMSQGDINRIIQANKDISMKRGQKIGFFLDSFSSTNCHNPHRHNSMDISSILKLSPSKFKQMLAESPEILSWRSQDDATLMLTLISDGRPEFASCLLDMGEGLDESYYGIADSIAHLCVTWHEHALLKKVLGLEHVISLFRTFPKLMPWFTLPSVLDQETAF